MKIKLRFLPPRMISAIQPLDQGIIKTFKSYYRGHLFKNVINKLELVGTEDLTAADISNKINVLDAISWVDISWKQVSTDCIMKCFHKPGFLIQPPSDELVALPPLVHNPLLPISATEFDEYVCADDDVAICCQPNEIDILNSILESEKEVDEDEEPELQQDSKEVFLSDGVKSASVLENFVSSNLPEIYVHVFCSK